MEKDQLSARIIPALDGWRGVAILSVLLWHLWPRNGETTPWFISFGWMGVDLFFVLSGFLITRILLASKSNAHYFRNFYARRTLRIFPLYYASLFVIYVAWPVIFASPSPDFALAGTGFGYLTNIYSLWTHRWFPAPAPFSGAHLWSLAIEEHFYLVWPLIVRRLNPRGLLVCCATLVTTSVILRVAFWYAGSAPIVAYTLTPCRMDSLAMGASLAIAAGSARWTNMARRVSVVMLPLSAAGLLFIFVRCHSLDVLANSLVYTLGLSLSAPFFTSLLCLTLARPPKNLLDRVMRFGPLRWFGKYSYGLYLYHGFLLFVFQANIWRWTSTHFGTGTAVGGIQFVLSVCVCSLIAFLSYHLFERQIFAFKRYFPQAMSRDGNDRTYIDRDQSRASALISTPKPTPCAD